MATNYFGVEREVCFQRGVELLALIRLPSKESGMVLGSPFSVPTMD
jgi:hypothetical protein